tara:strand:- start:385136 stop:387127 length:1992 start_codon:yes stop_codon:yes gene_type:complete
MNLLIQSMISRRASATYLVLTLLVFGTSPALAETAARKPNIVFIMADDLGWSDTTLYGTTELYRTPNIQRLARRGMTFTRAYSASPLCSPTRASVLTGMSPARTGITTPNCHLPKVVLQASVGAKANATQVSVAPDPVTRLDTKHDTIVDVLNDAGYATGHFGKWHLGPEPYSPIEHGFGVDIPHWAGPGPAGSYVAPWKFPDFDPQTPDEHIEDRMAIEAVAFMQKHRDEPFFLNYWMFSVHAPFDAKQKLIDEYKPRIDPSNPQRSPIYAAMIESMDDAVGTLLDTVDQLGVADNTIVIFASDNGGNMYNDVEGTTATSNAPLRGGKATMYEGGVRVPMIVCWPGAVGAGTRTDVLTNSCDFYPTILDMLSIDHPAQQRLDGSSLVPALRGQIDEDDELVGRAIFTYFPHNPPVPEWMPPSVSVHRDDWKLIRIFFGGPDGKHRYKLFDLKNDIGETNNLANAKPKLVAELDQLIETFLIETDAVRPVPNPAFNAASYRIENEGKPAARHIGGTKGGAKTNPERKPVAGWTPGGTCSITIGDNAIVVNSTGSDPHLSYSLCDRVAAGDFVLELEMSSDAEGGGQLYWQESGVVPRFAPQRSKRFDVQANGSIKRYEIPFTTEHELASIRLDPSRASGTIRVTKLKLRRGSGKVVKTWEFTH